MRKIRIFAGKPAAREQIRGLVLPLDRNAVQQERIRRQVLPLDRNAFQQERIRRQVTPLDRKTFQQEQIRRQVLPLGRYEQIYSSCIELRDRISHGESVPDAIVTELLGEWAKVTDFSWSGIGAETGITLTIKHIDIMAGACWIGRFSFLAGIGYAF